MIIHLSNIKGLGASQLVESLLPSLESVSGFNIKSIILPDSGLLSNYESLGPKTDVFIYRRFFPNSISRVFETLFVKKNFQNQYPILVFGDIPLRINNPQFVFVQSPHLISGGKLKISKEFFKYFISRAIFKFNLSKVKGIIVQTEVMKNEIVRSYPSVKGRVYLVAQPPPIWIQKSKLIRRLNEFNQNGNLNLIYPAANYPHKNLRILNKIIHPHEWPIQKLYLTINPNDNPAKNIDWIKCIGRLNNDEMLEMYSRIDALMFLSKKESYGFPLVEAMYIGIPILCPDLPYARILCGDQAIYFNEDDINSLKDAVYVLNKKLKNGWWPDWREQIKDLPKNWDSVAKQLIDIVYSEELQKIT